MYHKAVAASISNGQRRFLISLIDGPHPFVAHAPISEQATRTSLFRLHLIRFYSTTRDSICLTENGRQVVCFVLAEYAEALVRAEHAGFRLNEALTGVVDYHRHVEGRHPKEVEHA